MQARFGILRVLLEAGEGTRDACMRACICISSKGRSIDQSMD